MTGDTMQDEPETHYDRRLTYLDSELGSVKVEIGGMKSQMSSLAAGQDAIFKKLDTLATKFDNSRPSIGAIWAPLAVMTSILLGVGGVVARPYIGRVEENRAAILELNREADVRTEQIARLRIRQAVLVDRSARPIAATGE
jgi:hypothetical protein